MKTWLIFQNRTSTAISIIGLLSLIWIAIFFDHPDKWFLVLTIASVTAIFTGVAIQRTDGGTGIGDHHDSPW